MPVRGRDHARALRTRHQQLVGNAEVLDEAGGYRAATGLDAPGPVQQQDRAALAGEFVRGGGTGGATPDDDDVEDFVWVHDSCLWWEKRAGRLALGAAGGAEMRQASTAESRKTSASNANTVA